MNILNINENINENIKFEQDKNDNIDKNVKINIDKIKIGDNEIENENFKILTIYIHECIEIFISILIIRIAMEKNINITEILKSSLLIGIVISILDLFSSDFKSNVKQGITYSVGSQIISTFMN